MDNRFVSVGISLSSQGVATQVFSALVSLTSVFGMGTGGPSLQSIPTNPFLAERSIYYHKEIGLSIPFFKNFLN